MEKVGEEGRGNRPHAIPACDPDEDSGLHARWLTDLLASNDVACCVLEMTGTRGWDYRFLGVSPAFERSTGLHAAAGHTMRELRPDHEQYWFDLYQRVADTGEPVCFEHVASALERRFRGHAFRIGYPESPRIVVIFADTVDTGTAGFERFGATLAHELRSPLGSMGNGLAVLKDLPGQDPNARWTISMMERQLARLDALIADMLDIGRLGSTDVRLHCEDVDLHHVLSASIEACGSAIDAKNHEVAIDSDGSLLRVRADGGKLVQVFSNLLTNSIKYTPAGGHIGFRLRRDAGMAVVEVSDDGQGISTEELPHIFDLYHQGSPHRLQAQGSLGIGLSIVRSIVRLHGGIVEAHSAGPKQGSTFTVRLPISH
jgi:signal transduction histidine kinase